MGHGHAAAARSRGSGAMRGVDCDVLVVGLGPVGAAMAVLARLNGLSVIAIDREAEIFPLPRAAGFDHEAMRAFQMMGIAEQCERECRVMAGCQFVTAANEVLLELTSQPTGPYGWATNYALYQPAVEGFLRGRMADLGIDVRVGTALRSFDQSSKSVSAHVDGPHGDSRIRSRFLVGCDGSRSLVREALGVPLHDYDFDEPWLVVDTVIGEAANMPRVFHQICDPNRPVTYIWIGGDRFRWEFMLKPNETPEEMLHDDRIRELLAPWKCVDHALIERKAVYRFHGLVSARWRVGRVLIAGDAAHQMPPFLGQGMCSGIRDAVNLAWKLAEVVRGEADTAILDSYQAEREPHVRAIIEAAIGMGRIVCIQDPDAAAARDAEMLGRRQAGVVAPPPFRFPDLAGGVLTETPAAGSLFIQPVSADGIRFDGLLGFGPALIGRNLGRAGGGNVRLLDLDDPDLAPFRSAIVDWLSAAGAPAVLVRPDRHVFGTGDPQNLINAWHAELKWSMSSLD